MEVLALPFDPAALLDAPPARPAPAVGGDSASRYLALRDSALALDSEFQRERASLNREALALSRDTGRASRAYADRYAAWARRAAAVEQARARRDRVRGRLAALRARLGPAAPQNSSDGAARLLPGTTVDSAARATGRAPVRAALTAGSATLRLPPGRWWLTVGGPAGAAAGHATAVEVRPGARDTVHLSGA